VIRRPRRVLPREAGQSQDPEYGFDVAKPPRPERRSDRKDPCRVALREQTAADVPCNLGELFLPPAGSTGQRDLPADLVAQQDQQFFLVPDVAVLRRRLHVQPVRQPAHRQFVESDFVEQRKRGFDGLLLIECAPLAPACSALIRNDPHSRARRDSSNVERDGQRSSQ
jgi:hypothetical protein